MTKNCSACLHFKKGKPHTCRLTRHSCLWERATKMERFSKGKDGHHIYTPVKDNCGHEARHFDAKT